VRQAVLLTEEFRVTGAEMRGLLKHNRADPPVEPSGPPTSLREIADAAVESAERHAILRALQSTNGNKSQAARLLHVDFKTLHVKMRRYGITISHNPEA
jgi:two-component system nitrogen regulation response regulator GlnG